MKPLLFSVILTIFVTFLVISENLPVALPNFWIAVYIIAKCFESKSSSVGHGDYTYNPSYSEEDHKRIIVHASLS
jgi:hypothetical protein